MSNARHHPPAIAVDDESRAIAGRVHAVVRCTRTVAHFVWYSSLSPRAAPADAEARALMPHPPEHTVNNQPAEA
jgi:hypothetical protein